MRAPCRVTVFVALSYAKARLCYWRRVRLSVRRTLAMRQHWWSYDHAVFIDGLPRDSIFWGHLSYSRLQWLLTIAHALKKFRLKNHVTMHPCLLRTGRKHQCTIFAMTHDGTLPLAADQPLLLRCFAWVRISNGHKKQSVRVRIRLERLLYDDERDLSAIAKCIVHVLYILLTSNNSFHLIFTKLGPLVKMWLSIEFCE